MKAELKKIDGFLDRIVEAAGPNVIAAYEKRITTLEARKIELAEKIAATGQPKRGFEEPFRTAMAFLANPQKLWRSGRIIDQRLVLKLTFSSRLRHCRSEGFQAADLSMPFKVLQDLPSAQSGMACLDDGYSKHLFSIPADWDHSISRHNEENERAKLGENKSVPARHMRRKPPSTRGL